MLEVGGGGLLSQDIDIDDWKKRPRPSSGPGRAISVKASAQLRQGGSCASCAAGFCSVSADSAALACAAVRAVWGRQLVR